MFSHAPRLTKPGLFITATDTEVGKTVVTCAIAAAIRHQGMGRRRGDGVPPSVRVGVSKPMASGCRREREGLVNEDAEALAHFADCRQPLEVINPVRYAPPLAPAVAAERCNQPVDFDAIARSLTMLDDTSDVLLVEGVGGLMAPIDDRNPCRTVLDFAATLDYPVVIVARPGLGTLNHTAMTAALLKQRGVRIAGLVINRYDADATTLSGAADLSVQTNRQWLTKMTGVPVLATAPGAPPDAVQPHLGRIDDEILDAIAMTHWAEICSPPRRR